MIISHTQMPDLSRIKQFVAAFGGQWLTKMSGPLTVPLAIAALFVPHVWLRLLFALLAITCAIASAYGIWDRERRAKEQAIAALQSASQAKARDWAGDWKELAANFQAVPHRIRADWTKSSAGQSWLITGGDVEARRRVESLCKHAGNLLAASPRVARTLSPEFVPAPPIDRWLYHLKTKAQVFEYTGYAYEPLDTGERVNVLMGSIRDVAEVSANLCMECASEEY